MDFIFYHEQSLNTKNFHIKSDHVQYPEAEKCVRQGRAEPAKFVFRGNSTPPPRGAGWIASPDLSR